MRNILITVNDKFIKTYQSKTMLVYYNHICYTDLRSWWRYLLARLFAIRKRLRLTSVASHATRIFVL